MGYLERRVVGALADCTDPTLWDSALTLPVDAFTDPDLGVIFAVLKESWRKNASPPDEQAMGRALRTRLNSESLRSVLRSYLTLRRENLRCTKADVEEVRAAYEDSTLTRHIEFAVEALKGQATIGKQTYRGVEGCREILRMAAQTTAVEAGIDPFTAYQQRKQAGPKGVLCPPLLQTLIPPLQPGELHMIAGYASDGKTTLALNVLHGLHASTPALYVTMEAPSQRIHWLRASMLSLAEPPLLPYRQIKSAQLDLDQETHLRKLLQSTAEQTKVVDHPAGGAPAELMRLLNSAMRSCNHPVVVVDHLGLSAYRGRDYGSQLGELLRELKGFAIMHHTVVIILHQINRAGWEAAKKRGYYVLGALSETNAAEQVPDSVEWILRDSYLKSKMGCMKYRDEPRDLTRVIELSLDEETQVFSMEGEVMLDMGGAELELPI